MKKMFAIMAVFCMVNCGQEKENAPAPATKDSLRVVDAEPIKVQDSLIQQEETPLNVKSLQDGDCNYKNEVTDLGIGLLIAPNKFRIYDDKEITRLYFEWDYEKWETPSKSICALFYKPDYGILHYVCLDSTNEYYRILINGSQEKYVPRIYGKVFQDWQQYIFESIGGISLPANEAEGYYISMAPSEKAGKMAVQVNTFCPLQVKGDWVKVKVDCYTFDEKSGENCHKYIHECKATPTGWIRWRNGNKILIDISQLV